jgi:hypothetical protein
MKKKYSFKTLMSYKPKDDEYCHYSGLPSVKAYESKKNKITVMKKSILKWYPIIIAFICLLYSVALGLYGNTAEAMYSAHWPGTILLFSIAINQIKRQ